jgi:hypothetical protein
LDVGDIGSPNEDEEATPTQEEDPINVIHEIIGARVLEFEEMQ